MPRLLRAPAHCTPGILAAAAAAAAFASIVPLAVLPAQRTASAPLGASYQYDFRIGDHDAPSAGTTRVLGDVARIEMTGDSAQGWLLYDAGRGTMTAVHPDQRTYSVMDADRFADVVGVAMRAVGTVLSIRLRDVEIGARQLGPGGSIDGHPTVHSRLTQSYVTSVGIFGASDETRMRVVTDYWTATDVRIQRNPLFEMVSSAESALALRDAAFVAQSAKARSSLPSGMPLRTVVTATEIKDNGSDDTKTLSIEVMHLRPVSGMDPALFVVPAGYTRSSDWTYDSH